MSEYKESLNKRVEELKAQLSSFDDRYRLLAEKLRSKEISREDFIMAWQDNQIIKDEITEEIWECAKKYICN